MDNEIKEQENKNKEEKIGILNVYATNAVSTANGGVNQLIEAITIDSNI